MFRNVLRSHSTAMMAGAAAALTGGAVVSHSRKPETATVAQCSDNTVIGMLQELSLKVSNLESAIGAKKSDGLSNFRKGGIDIVLGAQGGDEGQGKLVDMLGQVSD